MPITRTELITALRDIAARLEQHPEVDSVNDIGKVHLSLWPENSAYEAVRAALGAATPQNEDGIARSLASFGVVDISICGWSHDLGTLNMRSVLTDVSEWTYKPPVGPA